MPATHESADLAALASAPALSAYSPIDRLAFATRYLDAFRASKLTPSEFFATLPPFTFFGE